MVISIYGRLFTPLMLAMDVSISVENLIDAKAQEIPPSCQFRQLCYQGFNLLIYLKWVPDKKNPIEAEEGNRPRSKH